MKAVIILFALQCISVGNKSKGLSQQKDIYNATFQYYIEIVPYTNNYMALLTAVR